MNTKSLYSCSLNLPTLLVSFCEVYFQEMLMFIPEWLRICPHFLYLSLKYRGTTCLAQVLSNLWFLWRKYFWRNMLKSEIFSTDFYFFLICCPHPLPCVSQVLLFNVCTAMAWTAMEISCCFLSGELCPKTWH